MLVRPSVGAVESNLYSEGRTQGGPIGGSIITSSDLPVACLCHWPVAENDGSGSMLVTRSEKLGNVLASGCQHCPVTGERVSESSLEETLSIITLWLSQSVVLSSPGINKLAVFYCSWSEKKRDKNKVEQYS